jgi:hypothetical protein
VVSNGFSMIELKNSFAFLNRFCKIPIKFAWIAFKNK